MTFGSTAVGGLFHFVVYVISSLAVPALGVAVSSIVVYCLTNGYDPGSYLALVSLLSLAAFVFEAAKIVSSSRYSWLSTFARCTTSWCRLTEKSITTDYLNVEPRDKMKAFDKAFQGISSNWIGLEYMMKQAPEVLIGAIGMLVYAAVVAVFVPWILLVLFFMVIANFFFSFMAFRFMRKNRDYDQRLDVRKWVLEEDTTNKENAKDVRAYRLERWFLSLFDELTKSRFSFDKKFHLRLFFGEVSDNIFMFARDAIAYGTLIALVLSGSIAVAEFTFLVGIVAGFSLWVNDFVLAFNHEREASILVDDYRGALAMKDSFNHGVGLDVASLPKPLEIVFDHVSFTYPGADKPSLRDVSLAIAPGEKIALVGNNGAGKTTLVKLLCGLYRPTSGRILIDGHEIDEFNEDEYMRLLSAVFQDVRPLAFTILSNVACASDDEADLPRFWSAVEQAGLKEKILSLPNKEKTFLTETFDLSGIRLSGGETQKLMLARALYKGAPLLVLDEPTSALDPLAEESMYNRYLELSKGNTSIFISHRLASTKFCDRIVFLSDGIIEETGTHDELIKGHGEYQKMFALQAKYYIEEGPQDGTGEEKNIT